MADSVDRVFGVALNTVSRIRPGSQKPPAADRIALYGLYKQAMEGDVSAISDRPTRSTSSTPDALKKEQEKWDAWRANEGVSRTEAKRRYIEKLIETMHQYASGTDEARELVDELEFVWDQVKSNSQPSSSERSSPLRASGRSGDGMSSSMGAMGASRGTEGGGMQLLSPVSQVDEDEERDGEDDGDEFVDAPVSQVDNEDIGEHTGGVAFNPISSRSRAQPSDKRWRKRVESSLIKLTTEVAALREQLESRRFFSQQRKNSILGWILRLSWWAIQLIAADAVILWIVILYMRRKKDHRLEGAVRVMLGDAVAQMQKVKIPQLSGKKTG